MPETTTTISALLKETYEPTIRKHVNEKRDWYRRLLKVTDKKRFSGEKYVIYGEDANIQSTGPVAEGGTLPATGNIGSLQMELTMQWHYGTAGITRRAASQSASRAGAFASIMDRVMTSLMSQFEEDLAINHTYGTGAGDLGQVSAYSGTTLTPVPTTTAGGVGVTFLRKNMYLSSYTALSGGTQGANHQQVSAINKSAQTATVPAAAGFAANDYLFRSKEASVDPRNQSVMGLGGIVDDATRVTTIQAASRTTYPDLKANVLGNSGTLRAWTPELMDDLASESEQNGGGGNPTAYLSRLEIQKRAAAYLRTDRRAPMQEMALDGGYKSLTWTSPDGTHPWFTDKFARAHEVMAIKEDDLFVAILEDTHFIDDDGGVWRYPQRVDTKEIWLVTGRNLGSHQFNNHSVLRDISYTL